MTAAEHDRHRDDVGAYLVGALPDDEARAYERHLETCHVCRDELEHLRPAVAVLPRSVPQFEPPPSLKASLMETVRAEAARKPARGGLRARFANVKPRVAWSLAAVVLAVAVAAGFGVAQLASNGGENPPSLAATVDQTRLGDASATFTPADGGRDGGTLNVQDFPRLKPGRTYQAWTATGKTITRQPTFDVNVDGDGSVTLPGNLRNADAVLVTREPAGGSAAPTEQPLLRVDL